MTPSGGGVGISNIDEALRLRDLVASGEITHGEAVHRLCQFSECGLTPLGAKDVLRYAHLYAQGRSRSTHPHLFQD